MRPAKAKAAKQRPPFLASRSAISFSQTSDPRRTPPVPPPQDAINKNGRPAAAVWIQKDPFSR